jgi:hypothetical protein
MSVVHFDARFATAESQIVVVRTSRSSYMQRYLFPIILFIGMLASGIAQADEQSPLREQPTWRFEFANDFMFSSDNQYTNGVTVQKHSTISGDIDDLQ